MEANVPEFAEQMKTAQKCSVSERYNDGTSAQKLLIQMV